MRTFVATILLFTRFSSYAAEKAGVVVDHVVVYKQYRKLVLLSDGKALKSHRIALGGDPVGPKTRQGDHRTPEGSYALDSRNPNSHSYKAFHLSYPSSNVRATSHPPRNWASARVVTSCCMRFPRIMRG